MKLYVDDNRETFPPATVSQYNPAVSPNLDYEHGNFLGGNDPLPPFNKIGGIPSATNRLLNPYVSARDAWHCPADRGFLNFRPTCFGAFGNNYEVNWTLPGNYGIGDTEDPVYNLGLKKESWPPEPARYILMHEIATYPWSDAVKLSLTQWHNAASPGQMYDANTIKGMRDKLVAPVLFVDGHVQQCDFTATMKKDPVKRGLEPGKDFMWYKPLK